VWAFPQASREVQNASRKRRHQPGEESAALITTGVFRITRNPMYLGYVLILIGVALIVTSVTPYAVIAVFAILMDRVFMRVEEQMLGKQY
jgi:protein-S-isoprenylcysteine O-methyltransferase Ste14